MVNENFRPDDRQEQVLDVLKDEGRVNPYRVRELTDLRKQYVNDSLQSLVDAGWARKVTQGLYEFVEDPRERDADE